MERTQKILYFSVLIFLFVALLFSSVYFFGDRFIWELFSKAYFVLILLNIWYVFFMLFIQESNQDRRQKYKGEPISVVLSCFNEDPKLLWNTVRSIMSAKGEKEIVLVDDGSNEETKEAIKSIKRYYRGKIRLYFFEENRGKRVGIFIAVKYALRNPYVVTVDSDTILDKNALVNIVTSLKRRGVGAVSGDVLLLNERRNLLTRIVSAYYWVALKIGRKSESALGNVACCSGCIAGYRSSLIKKVIDDFVGQTFLDKRCTHGEDRHLTNLILKLGYKVVFDHEAIAYTETPFTLLTFLKQQMRWKRGFIRESIFTLTFAWRNKKLLFINVLRDLLLIFAAFAFKIVSLVVLFTEPIFFLKVVLPAMFFFVFVRDIYLFISAPRKIFSLFLYVIANEFIFSWQYIYALFTIRYTGWSTRGSTIV